MSKQILWLDNDTAYLVPFVEALEDEGYSVVVVESLTDAEQSLRDKKFDLLIVDIMIPTLSRKEETRYRPEDTDLGYKTGLVFYKQNKEALQKAGTRVMVMTVRLDKAIMDDFIKAGLPGSAFATKYEMAEPTNFLNKILATLEDKQTLSRA